MSEISQEHSQKSESSERLLHGLKEQPVAARHDVPMNLLRQALGISPTNVDYGIFNIGFPVAQRPQTFGSQ